MLPENLATSFLSKLPPTIRSTTPMKTNSTGTLW